MGKWRVAIAGGALDAWAAWRLVNDLREDFALMETLADPRSWASIYLPLLIGSALLIWAFWPRTKPMKSKDTPPSSGVRGLQISNCISEGGAKAFIQNNGNLDGLIVHNVKSDADSFLVNNGSVTDPLLMNIEHKPSEWKPPMANDKKD